MVVEMVAVLLAVLAVVFILLVVVVLNLAFDLIRLEKVNRVVGKIKKQMNDGSQGNVSWRMLCEQPGPDWRSQHASDHFRQTI